MTDIRHRLRALPLLLLLLAAPAAALDTIWLVRHAEKLEPWPSDLDALQPLSQEGTARAEALAVRLKDAGIAAVYTSRTTRTLATGHPLATRPMATVPLIADDDTIDPKRIKGFLTGLKKGHAHDRAVLIVGHSNTIPQLLKQLGATPVCFERLGIHETPSGPLIEGFDGVWRVELAKPGCAGMTRRGQT